MCNCIGGSGGGVGARDTRPHLSGPKFLHFHAVFGQNWSNSMLRSPELAHPPLGNSESASELYQIKKM